MEQLATLSGFWFPSTGFPTFPLSDLPSVCKSQALFYIRSVDVWVPAGRSLARSFKSELVKEESPAHFHFHRPSSKKPRELFVVT